jgi:hypothetical protein
MFLNKNYTFNIYPQLIMLCYVKFMLSCVNITLKCRKYNLCDLHLYHQLNTCNYCMYFLKQIKVDKINDNVKY